MNWLYKTVEFGKRDYQKLYSGFKDIEKTVHREAEDDFVVEFPDYREKKDTMKKSDFEAFMQKEFYPIRDQMVRERTKEFLDEYTTSLPEESDIFLYFSFPKYLELLINIHASQGWILDKIRNQRDSEMDGYMVFRKEV